MSMKKDDMDKILKNLGLNNTDLAALGGVNRRTVQGWVDAGRVNNGFAAVLLRLLAAHPDYLPDVWEAAGLPDGRQARPRGRPAKREPAS